MRDLMQDEIQQPA